jgi:hypothetical protein
VLGVHSMTSSARASSTGGRSERFVTRPTQILAPMEIQRAGRRWLSMP